MEKKDYEETKFFFDGEFFSFDSEEIKKYKKNYKQTDIFCDGEVPEVNPNEKNDDYGNDERGLFRVMNYSFILFFIMALFADIVLETLVIYLLSTPIVTIRYLKRKRVIKKHKGYPARIIAVKSGTRMYGGGKYRGTIRTYTLEVKYAKGITYIKVDDQDPISMLENPYCTLYIYNGWFRNNLKFISDCKIKQEVKDRYKFWKKKK